MTEVGPLFATLCSLGTIKDELPVTKRVLPVLQGQMLCIHTFGCIKQKPETSPQAPVAFLANIAIFGAQGISIFFSLSMHCCTMLIIIVLFGFG